MNEELKQLDISTIEIEQIQIARDIDRLESIRVDNGFTKADVVDLENISGEALVTNEYSIVMFGSYPTHTGEELIGEGLVKTVSELTVKFAKSIFSLIKRIMDFGRKMLFGFSGNSKEVYGGSYGKGTGVTTDMAKRAVIEQILKDNDSVFAEQFIRSNALHTSYQTLSTNTAEFGANLQSTIEEYDNYLDTVIDVVEDTIKEKEKVFKTLSKDGNLKAMVSAKQLDEMEKLSLVNLKLIGDIETGKLKVIPGTSKLVERLNAIRFSYPKIKPEIVSKFPELEKAIKDVSAKKERTIVYHTLLNKSLSSLVSEKSTLAADSYSFDTIVEKMKNVESSYSTMEMNVHALEAVSDMFDRTERKHERVVKTISELQRGTSNNDTLANNLIKDIKGTVRLGLVEIQTAVKVIGLGYKNYRAYVKVYKSIEDILEANKKLI